MILRNFKFLAGSNAQPVAKTLRNRDLAFFGNGRGHDGPARNSYMNGKNSYIQCQVIHHLSNPGNPPGESNER